jgi:hypothetical protein
MYDVSSNPIRKIVHIDMVALYASVEQQDSPDLRGKPLAVGGSAARGVVAAASYEARAFSVHSAMPSVSVKRKCPHLIFVPPRHRHRAGDPRQDQASHRLNASAGISYNKFLAKMASDLNKPNGQAVIKPQNGPAFVEASPSESSTASARQRRRRSSGSGSKRAPTSRRRHSNSSSTISGSRDLFPWHCPRHRRAAGQAEPGA